MNFNFPNRLKSLQFLVRGKKATEIGRDRVWTIFQGVAKNRCSLEGQVERMTISRQPVGQQRIPRAN